MPGYFPEAVSLVEGLCPVVDRQDVQDDVLAVLTGGVDEPVDEVRADAATLVLGVELDAGQVNLGRAVFDDQEAGVYAGSSDDLPLPGVEGACVKPALDIIIPAPDRADVGAHGGLVQLEAEFAVCRCCGPQFDGGHIAHVLISHSPGYCS